jgi:hypothetical protein
VWRNSIAQQLATGQGAQGLNLFERAKDQLVPADQRALDVPIQAARTDFAADQWIAAQVAKEGEPLRARLDANQELSPAEKSTALAKIEAQDSARESARVATVRGLDDKLDAAAQSLATAPGTYKPGTLAELANAYEDAGEADKANAIRRLAVNESFLSSFARGSAAAQQRLIDSLPEGEDRAAAEVIRERQKEAFDKNPFSAGTALYPDVGPPKPADDMPGRIAQARAISAYRDIPVVPFTADEIATMKQHFATGTPQERDAVLTLVNSLPDDMKPRLDEPSGSQPATFRIDAQASIEAANKLREQEDDQAATGAGRQGAVQASEPPPDSVEYRNADAEAQKAVAQERVLTDRAVSQWVNQARPGDELPPRLADRLSGEEKREIESVVSGAADASGDSAVFKTLFYGLTSRNPAEQRRWAQAPLYKYRPQLSAGDFAKLVTVQQDLDPEDGHSRSEIAAIRKQLAARPNTSDLDELYKALEPDPNAEYGTWPFAKDRNGVRPAMPSWARSFLKGVLDLFAGTKTGKLTPEAIDAFTTITGGAGRAFGPRGGAETLAAGGKSALGPRPYAKGHHWVPGPIRRLPDLSPDARKVFNDTFSGWYGELHPWSKPHAEYNQAVTELWAKNHYNSSKMTKKDAEDFVKQVKKSRDPRIAKFRDEIIDKLWKYELRSGLPSRGGDEQ